MTDRSTRYGIRGSGARLLARLAAAVALLVTGSVWVPLPTVEAATACGGVVAEGQIRVVIVVDGGVGGQAPRATCLVVARGTTGGQLLADRAATLGVSRPRYADSGLLCGIDGYPASGCGEPTADGYRYWAYFSGTSGAWVYGGGNPFLRRLADGDIEGWRFVAGTGTGQDPPPRIAPSPGLFPPVAPPPPPPAPAPSVPAAPSAPVAPAAGASGGSDVSVAPDVSMAPSGGDVPAAGSAATDAMDATVEDGQPTTTAVLVDDTQGPVEELASSTPSGSDSSGAGPTGLILAAIVIGGLVTATVVTARSRR